MVCYLYLKPKHFNINQSLQCYQVSFVLQGDRKFFLMADLSLVLKQLFSLFLSTLLKLLLLHLLSLLPILPTHTKYQMKKIFHAPSPPNNILHILTSPLWVMDRSHAISPESIYFSLLSLGV